MSKDDVCSALCMAGGYIHGVIPLTVPSHFGKQPNPRISFCRAPTPLATEQLNRRQLFTTFAFERGTH